MTSVSSSEAKVLPTRLKISFNPVLCIWCRCCELTCSLVHEGTCSPALSRICMSIDQFEAKASTDFCPQCDEAECLHACPNGAIFVDQESGARVIDETKCVGCGACASACPYNSYGTIIARKPDRDIYMKCDLCRGLGGPKCVDVCPQGALKYAAVGGV